MGTAFVGAFADVPEVCATGAEGRCNDAVCGTRFAAELLMLTLAPAVDGAASFRDTVSSAARFAGGSLGS